MGFNYTAVDQSEQVTGKRIAQGECLVAIDARDIVGMVMLHPVGRSGGCPCYERPGVATIGQFAVMPHCQNGGVGSSLLREAEQRASMSSATNLALGTSEGADHLIAWYARKGFYFVEYARGRARRIEA